MVKEYPLGVCSSREGAPKVRRQRVVVGDVGEHDVDVVLGPVSSILRYADDRYARSK